MQVFKPSLKLTFGIHRAQSTHLMLKFSLPFPITARVKDSGDGKCQECFEIDNELAKKLTLVYR